MSIHYPSTYCSGLEEDRSRPALYLQIDRLPSSNLLFLSPHSHALPLVQSCVICPRAGRKTGYYCAFLLKEIACLPVPKLCRPVVDTARPTSVTKIQSAWKISAEAKQEPASFSAAVIVNTNPNVCISVSHGWITLSTSALFQ